jgi:DNA-binding transcriptional LysR family regulator
MTMAGFGMAFLPESLIEDDLKSEFLVPSLPKRYQMDLDIMIIRRAEAAPADQENLWALLLKD